VARLRSVAAVPAADVATWDDEADVLVIGYGSAGASAALEARGQGADVLVLERASGPGGTSALSGGELYLGGGTPLQRDCGIDDSAEAMAGFLREALGPGVDEDKLSAYVSGSVEHAGWLEAQGVPFTRGLYDDPSWMPPTDDGLMWLGERSWPFTEIAKPAPRGHRPATGHFGGWLLMEKLSAAATSEGTRAAFDTYAERLVVEDGRVVGVLARQYGEDRAYRARRAVVLTTGGFVDDDEMLSQHAPRLLPMDKISCGGEDGSGIRMAQALGAAVKHMGAAQVGFHAVPAMMARGIVVNRRGQRFINEDTYPGRVGQAALFGQGMGCWVVLDEKGYEEVPPGDRWGVLPHETADTVAELEKLMGLPDGALQATVAEYNRHASVGEDPVCHKDSRWLRPLEPPFAAIDPTRSFRGPNDPAVGSGAAVFTLGGLDTDVEGHVRHVDGTLIPGLFAAGRASSGLAAWGYISGTSLGDATFFGRQAGRAAALTTQGSST
jgi:3-oxo-5alpha-steroid 4-dehydrogenase